MARPAAAGYADRVTVARTRLDVATRGRGTHDVTAAVARAVTALAGGRDGLAHLWCHHTSASLIVCENADGAVRRDLDAFFARLVPDGDPLFTHDAEGDDDMPAHVRTVLTHTGLTVPVAAGALDLGTWQGLYLWEHRAAPHRRRLTVTVVC